MIQQIDDSLYQTICSWWIAHNWPVLPKEMLPKRGYMAFLGEKPIIAGFLYKDETSAFGMMEWMISNPDSSREQRDESFKELIKHVQEVSKEIGVRFLFTTTSKESLINRYKDAGFLVSDQSVTHLTKEILCQ